MLKNIRTLFTFDISLKLNIGFFLTCIFLLFITHIFGIFLSKTLINNDVIIESIKTEKQDNWLMLILLAPIMEELIFRLGLSLKKMDLSLSFAAAFLFFYSGDSFKHLHFLNFDFLIGLLFTVFVFILSFKVLTPYLLNYLKVHKMKVYYCSVFLFTIVHFSLDTPLDTMIKSMPALFVGGAIFTFVRLKFSIVYSVLLHVFLNSVPLIILWFA